MVDSLAVRHYAKLQKNYEQKLIFFKCCILSRNEISEMLSRSTIHLPKKSVFRNETSFYDPVFSLKIPV